MHDSREHIQTALTKAFCIRSTFLGINTLPYSTADKWQGEDAKVEHSYGYGAKMAVTSSISAAMDLIDQQLLSLLRQDARRSISNIAVSLGISRGTVRSRIERLERSGVIIGYAAIISSDESGRDVRGVMMIDIEGQATERVTRTLRGFAEVLAIHSTNGRWDLVVELATDTLGDFDAILGRIRQIPGVAGSETSLLLTTSRNVKGR